MWQQIGDVPSGYVYGFPMGVSGFGMCVGITGRLPIRNKWSRSKKRKSNTLSMSSLRVDVVGRMPRHPLRSTT